MSKYKGKQLISLLLITTIMLGLLPMQVFANDNIPKKEITRFIELEENIKNQTYNVGDDV